MSELQIKNSKKDKLPFLGRRYEKEILIDFISQDVGSHSAKRFFNICGVGGVGKTRLIKECVNNLSANTTCIYIQLDSSNLSLKSCLTLIVNAFEQSGISLPLETNLISSSQLTSEQEALLIAKAIDKLSFRTVLIFDELIEIGSWFNSFEEIFLATIQKPLVVLGSRSEIHLSRFELRLQFRSFQLQSLDTNDKFLNEQLAEYLASNFDLHKNQQLLKTICENLNNFSFGNPAALNLLINQIGENWQLLLSEPEEQIEIRQFLADMLIERYGAARYSTHEQQNEVLMALKELSIFRRYDVLILQKALIESPDRKIETTFKYFGNNPLYFSALSQSIVGTRLVEWNIQRRGFVLDYSFRRILAESLFAENPHRYNLRHENAIQQYVQLLQSERGEKETRIIYILELMYHIACANSPLTLKRLYALKEYILGSDEERLPLANDQEVGEIVSQWSVPDIKQIASLYLAKTYDAEELRSRLSKNNFSFF